MTLDEHINDRKRGIMSAERIREFVKNHSLLDSIVDNHNDILKYLEELKELREKYNFEVEMCKEAIGAMDVYRKALELSCERLSEHSTQTKEYFENFFIQKAREEE